MCGRFAFYSPREAITRLFGVEFPLDFAPRYNIAPTQHVAALRLSTAGTPEPAMLRWGLVPSWAKDAAIGNRLINARAETVAEKPSFRAAYRRRRCVILADGFYEWQAVDGAKQPYFIAAADAQPFAMAGLWERWDREAQPLETCTIITAQANRFMRALHARMPVVLETGDVGRWLERGDADLLAPCREDRLIAQAVARSVNNPRNEGPELIAPLS